jgi:hypothetical protein
MQKYQNKKVCISTVGASHGNLPNVRNLDTDLRKRYLGSEVLNLNIPRQF